MYTEEIYVIYNVGIYAVKVKQAPLSKDKEACSAMLIVGDLSHRIVDQLATLVDNIVAPLLTKAENHKDLPEIAIHDICKHVHALRGTLYQVIRQSITNIIIFKTLPVQIKSIIKKNTTLEHTGERTGKWTNGAAYASWSRKGNGSREIGFHRGTASG